ncbi:MAG: hypothetical protein WBA74_20715 [Cyclobacteriaceae bacterium]
MIKKHRQCYQKHKRRYRMFFFSFNYEKKNSGMTAGGRFDTKWGHNISSTQGLSKTTLSDYYA